MRKRTGREKEGMCNGGTAREGENADGHEKTGKRTAARYTKRDTDEKTLRFAWVIG
jgi:hypothetical protein